MRVRLLRNVRMAGASSVELLAGTVVNTTPDVAEKWIKQGTAMLDKSLDGPGETKEVAPLYVSDKPSKPRKMRNKKKA